MSDDDIKVIAGNRPTELERLRAELAELKSHDHAPCVLCEPLRLQIVAITEELATEKEKVADLKSSVHAFVKCATELEKELAVERGRVDDYSTELVTAQERVKGLESKLIDMGLAFARRDVDCNEALERVKELEEAIRNAPEFVDTISGSPTCAFCHAREFDETGHVDGCAWVRAQKA